MYAILCVGTYTRRVRSIRLQGLFLNVETKRTRRYLHDLLLFDDYNNDNDNNNTLGHEKIAII